MTTLTVRLRWDIKFYINPSFLGKPHFNNEIITLTIRLPVGVYTYIHVYTTTTLTVGLLGESIFAYTRESLLL